MGNLGGKTLCRPAATGGTVGEFVGLEVLVAADVSDGKFETSGQFAAGPVEGVKPGAATGVLAGHLTDDDLGVGVDL